MHFGTEIGKRGPTAAYVTGGADYKVTVECAGAEGLDAFVRWVRADEVVARTESQLILRTIVE